MLSDDDHLYVRAPWDNTSFKGYLFGRLMLIYAKIYAPS